MPEILLQSSTYFKLINFYFFLSRHLNVVVFLLKSTVLKLGVQQGNTVLFSTNQIADILYVIDIAPYVSKRYMNINTI